MIPRIKRLPIWGPFFVYNHTMGKWIHRLTNIDEASRTADCKECGRVTVRKRGRTKSGIIWRCNRSDRYSRNHREYRELLKDTCERCGFVPENVCQLDIHHIDGNHSNNKESNLGTLCANCHRLAHPSAKASILQEASVVNSRGGSSPK